MPRGGPRPGGFHKGHKFNQGRTKTQTAPVTTGGQEPKKRNSADVAEMLMAAIIKRGGKKFFSELSDKELAALAGRILPKDYNVNTNSSISISINLSTSPIPLDVTPKPGETRANLIEQAITQSVENLNVPLVGVMEDED